MRYLARGPVGTTGIDSKAHGSKEPTPFRVQTVSATGGEGVRPFINSAWTRNGVPFLASHTHSPTSFSPFQTSPPQATP
jgi:hypothetical protein